MDFEDFFELFLGLEWDRDLRRQLLERDLERRLWRDECDFERRRSRCRDRDRLSRLLSVDLDLDFRSFERDLRPPLDLD